MAIDPRFPAHPSLTKVIDPERMRLGLGVLREEIESELDPAKRAALLAEIATLHERMDDAAQAARDALAATNLVGGFVEPVELLLAISHEKKSRGNVRKLLGRLQKLAHSDELSARALLERYYHAKADGDEDETRELADLLAANPATKAQAALLAELSFAGKGDLEGRLEAALSRGEIAESPEIRAEMFERASRLAKTLGRPAESLAHYRAATTAAPSERRLLETIRLLRENGDRREAAKVAEVFAERVGADPRIRALSLALLVSLSDDEKAETHAFSLIEAASDDPFAYAVALAALARDSRDGDERSAAVRELLERSAGLALDDADRALVLLSRSLASENPGDAREGAKKALELFPNALVPSALLLEGIAKNPSETLEKLARKTPASATFLLARHVLARLRGERGENFETTDDLTAKEFARLERAARFGSSERKLSILDAEHGESTSILSGEGALLFSTLFEKRPEVPASDLDGRTLSIALAEKLKEIWRLASNDESGRRRALEEFFLLAEPRRRDDFIATLALALGRDLLPERVTELLEPRDGENLAPSERDALHLLRALIALEKAETTPNGREKAKTDALASLRKVSLETAPSFVSLLHLLASDRKSSLAEMAFERGELFGAIGALRDVISLARRRPEETSELWGDLEASGAFDPSVLGWLRGLLSFRSDSAAAVETLRELRDPPPRSHLDYLALRSEVRAGAPLESIDASAARFLEGLSSDESRDESEFTDALVLNYALALGAQNAERALDFEAEIIARSALRVPFGTSPEELFRRFERLTPGPSGEKIEVLSTLLATERDPLEAASARVLLAYDLLLEGDPNEALREFEALHAAYPDDGAALEGIAATSELLGHFERQAEALATLAQNTRDENLAGELWEKAGRIFLDAETSLSPTRRLEKAEECLSASLACDPERESAFDELFRLVRARGDSPRLLELLDARIDVPQSPETLRGLLWEKALLCKGVGRRAAAHRSLTALLDLDPENLPALALLAELLLTEERAGEAATILAKVARHPDTSTTDRLAAGTHAIDLLESDQRVRDALDLTRDLVALGIPEATLREKRARLASRVGEWAQAFRDYRDLNEETDSVDVRLESARLMLALQREHLRDFGGIEDAARRVLRDAPTDPDAVDAVLEGNFSEGDRKFLLAGPLALTKQALRENPLDASLLADFARLTEGSKNNEERGLLLGILSLSGRLESDDEAELDEIASRRRRIPEQTLGEADLRELLPRTFHEPSGVLARLLGRAIGIFEAPNLASLGVGVGARVDPFAGNPVRQHLGNLATLFGLGDFELYLGGTIESAIVPFHRDFPSLLVGHGVQIPLIEETFLRAGLAFFSLRFDLVPFLTEKDEPLLEKADALLTSNGPSSLLDALSREDREECLHAADELRARGGSAEHILLAAKSALTHAAVFLHGDVSVLVNHTGLLPTNADLRRTLLADAIALSLSPELSSLRRKVGLFS